MLTGSPSPCIRRRRPDPAKAKLDSRSLSHGSVSITRGRRGTERAPRPFGEEETLLETAEATLALLHVDSGRSLDGIASTPARRLGWLVAGQLGSPPIAQHEPRELARMLKSENHGAERATVFLCSVLGAGE